jgi:hypothetical protein
LVLTKLENYPYHFALHLQQLQQISPISILQKISKHTLSTSVEVNHKSHTSVIMIKTTHSKSGMRVILRRGGFKTCTVPGHNTYQHGRSLIFPAPLSLSIEQWPGTGLWFFMRILHFTDLRIMNQLLLYSYILYVSLYMKDLKFQWFEINQFTLSNFKSGCPTSAVNE